MSFQVSAVATPSLNPAAEINRRSANFRPSLWGDRFLTYTSEFLETDHEKIQQQLQELKKEVRKMLMAPGQKSSQKLNFIDAIQRLGVSYHFEIEIQQILRQLHKSTLHDPHDHEDDDDDDLYTVALRFRLLRQHGYNVLSDMFAKFKDNNGNFKESLVNDAQGMLSLYEAAHLRVHGEDILDEALVFTTTHLESVAAHLSPLLAAQVSHALKKPIHKGLPRLEARYYFSIFQQDASHNEVLLAFAKLDFNILQKLHQKELSEISRWWKDLNLAGKLPFIRDRVVECYFWILGVYFEPEYLLARRLLTKVIAMTSAIDDINDVYGTLEELELFTEAIERWDTGATNQLPEYMKLCYRALLDVYTEMGQKIGEEKLYRVQYAREAMKNQVRSYFKEAKWFHQKYTPTVTEYMHTAIVSSGYPLLAITSFVGMGDIVTKDSFEWLCSQPKAVTASSVIARLMDDMMSHKFEQKRGHVASAVECYMIEHGATEEEAIKEFWKQVTDAWKDVNEECLYPTTSPMPPLMPILNLTRVSDIIYNDQDNYTNPGDGLKDFVYSLLIEPVPL